MQKEEKFANATIGSALDKFARRLLCRGQRIPIGAKSAGRRRSGVSKGKAKIPSGRPKGAKIACFPKLKHIMKVRRQPKGKRPHSLHLSIFKGTQNAGKW